MMHRSSTSIIGPCIRPRVVDKYDNDSQPRASTTSAALNTHDDEPFNILGKWSG